LHAIVCRNRPNTPKIKELLDRHKQTRIALDPSILVGRLPMPSSAKELLERVAAEDANGELWSSQFDVLAKITEIAGLLERLSAGKR